MAAVDAKSSFEDVDLFTIPHNRMKHILTRVSKRVKHTDFSSTMSFLSLLSELVKTFTELKTHEEIENKYIMKILKRRLRGEALKKLLIHLHAHSHISDILNLVKSTEKECLDGLTTDMKTQGLRLNEAVQEFFDEYLPHMMEEEQVLQPMLMKFLSANELKHIKEIVLQLHQLKDLQEKQLVVEQSIQTHFENLEICIKDETLSSSRKSINILPAEVLNMIFSYLNPEELCRCAQVNSTWNEAVFSGGLWHTLRPSRWATGNWRFDPVLDTNDCNCDCQPNYGFITFKDYSDDKNSGFEDNINSASDSEESSDLSDRPEARILNGLSRYVLPRIGMFVQKLDLGCSKAITNGLLFRMLSKCKNLEYLDVSQTIISDIGLLGLFKVECPNLLHLDVSGCENITDKMLIKLSTALGKKSCCKSSNKIRQLQSLKLCGCYKITDVGLRALSKHGGLPHLQHLDLSGCFNVTNDGIHELISTSYSFESSELYCCDNIILEGHYANTAGSCQTVDCANRVCCRNLRE